MSHTCAIGFRGFTVMWVSSTLMFCIQSLIFHRDGDTFTAGRKPGFAYTEAYSLVPS